MGLDRHDQALLAVEEAAGQWAYSVVLAANGELPHEQVWSHAGDLATAMAEVARHVNCFPDGPLPLQG